MPDVAKGLAGVVVEETAVSEVLPAGYLRYRGYDIEDLVAYPVAQVAGLIVEGNLSTDLEPLLKAAANLTARETDLVLQAPADLHPMRLLQGVVPLLSRGEALGYGEADQGLHVAAKLPALVATHLRRAAVELDVSQPYAERFLLALGNHPSALQSEAFNITQILQLEHSFNAGTFAARVVASTLAPVEAAIAAGFGALSGSLHGGADEAVLNIADGLDSIAAAERYVDQTLVDGGKIPGMGHREYRERDPRARILEAWAQRLVAGTPAEETFAILAATEKRFREAMIPRGKPLHANVEFYKGVVYRALGLPNRFFTAGFAMARVFGYIAHFIESRQDNRIYRPAASYVGPRRAPARRG